MNEYNQKTEVSNVNPKKLKDEEIIEAVKQNFNVSIERQNDIFGYADTSTENRHDLSKEITLFINSLEK